MPPMAARPGTRTLLRALGRRLPRTRGVVPVRGLRDDVIVSRDRWGIPHIEAGTDADAWFALGYCHAQDRAFQLELIARAGRGLLAELLGAAALPIDRLSRTLGFRRVARAQVERLDPDVLPVLEAYVAGVNAAHAQLAARARARAAARRPERLDRRGRARLPRAPVTGARRQLGHRARAPGDPRGRRSGGAGSGRADLRTVAAGRDAARARTPASRWRGWRATSPGCAISSAAPAARTRGRSPGRGPRQRSPDPRQRPAPGTGGAGAVVPRPSAHARLGGGRRVVRRRPGLPDRLQRARRLGHHRGLHRLGRSLLGGALARTEAWPGARKGRSRSSGSSRRSRCAAARPS